MQKNTVKNTVKWHFRRTKIQAGIVYSNGLNPVYEVEYLICRTIHKLL